MASAVDPQFSDPLPDDEKAKYYKIPQQYHIDREAVEKVDYMIVNHCHCDHIIDLGYFAKKFNPIIICSETIAYGLAKTFDIPFTLFYPVGAGETHMFPDFTLNTIHGCHMPQPFTFSNMPNIMDKSYGVTGDGTMEIGHLGGLFALNYMITTNENLRIGFFAGRMDFPSYPGLKAMEELRPNVMIRQIPVNLPEHPAEVFAKEFKMMGAQILLPMHHETFEIARQEFFTEMFLEINQLMENAGLTGRAFQPIRGQWYSLNLGLETVL